MVRVFILYIVLINVISYVAMWLDKYQSKKKGFRISERTLLVLATLFGSVGIYLGMKAPIYHKASKTKFKIGVPLLLIFNIVLVFLWNYFFSASQ